MEKNIIEYVKKKSIKISTPAYYGKLIDTMPKLIAAGQTPISIARMMEQRVNAWNSTDKSLIFTWEKGFTTGDSIMYHLDGRIKLILDSQTLWSIDDNTTLKKWCGSKILRAGTFDNAVGLELSKKEFEKYAKNCIGIKNKLNNPIWRHLARGDEKLLKEYFNYVYLKLENDDSILRTVLYANEIDFELEKSLSLGSLETQGSILVERLDDDDSYIVGVMPDVWPYADTIRSNSQFDLEGLIKNIKALRDDGHISPALEKVFRKYYI